MAGDYDSAPNWEAPGGGGPRWPVNPRRKSKKKEKKRSYAESLRYEKGMEVRKARWAAQDKIKAAARASAEKKIPGVVGAALFGFIQSSTLKKKVSGTLKKNIKAKIKGSFN